MNSEDQKIVEVENEPVSRLLEAMKRVEAPGDFDFRVKARIAQGRPVEKSASLLPSWVRVAFPLVLLLFVGAFFGFRTLYFSEPKVLNDVAALGTQQSSIEPANQVSMMTELQVNKTTLPQVSDKSVDLNPKLYNSSSGKFVARTGSSNRNSGGGSFVDMGRSISKARSMVKPKGFDKPAGIAAKDIFSPIGIDASYSASSWKVNVVRPNTIAERSGLKAGDVVESINGQSLTEKTSFPSPFSGKSIGVRRDGKIVQIELKP